MAIDESNIGQEGALEEQVLGERQPDIPNRLSPVIEFRDVRLAFDDNVVLDGISFEVHRGETKIILGRSGGGKSTIIRLILGLLKPDSGTIYIDGIDISAFDEEDLMPVRKKIGMIFQEGALFDSLSVYDNVAYRLIEEGVDPATVDHAVKEMLQFVGLEEAIDKMPNELSGGMRRRVGIARALVGRPSIVMFDEPTAGLDPPTARTICELAVKLRDIENVASIFVTHEMKNLDYLSSESAVLNESGQVIYQEEEAGGSVSTQVLMLRDGKIVFSGTDEELRSSDDEYIQHFIHGKM